MVELGQVESPKWGPEFTVEDCSQHLLHLDKKNEFQAKKNTKNQVGLEAMRSPTSSKTTTMQPTWPTVRLEAVRSTSSKTTTVSANNRDSTRERSFSARFNT